MRIAAAVVLLAAVLAVPSAALAQDPPPSSTTDPVVVAVNALTAEVQGLRAEAVGRGAVVEGLRAETTRNGARLTIAAQLLGLLVVFTSAGWCIRVFTRPGGVP